MPRLETPRNKGNSCLWAQSRQRRPAIRNYYFVLGRNIPGNEILDCGRGAPFLPSPYDCHSFYRCFTTTSGPVQMSCGFLMFNPLLR